MDATDLAIELVGVGKSFGSPRRTWLQPSAPPVTALRDVTLSVRRGEALGISGPNGAGKTTLLKLIAALMHPNSGRVRVLGEDSVVQGASIRPRVGFVPAQERSWYGRLTVRQNLRFFAQIKGLDAATTSRRVDELAGEFGLGPVLDRRAHAVSSGFLQRCSVARALLAEPELLLMDEPTRSLDEAMASQVRRFVRSDHVQRRGRTLVVATHQARDLGVMCDRVAGLHEGRLSEAPLPTKEHAARHVAESIRIVARASNGARPPEIDGASSRALRDGEREGELEYTLRRRAGDDRLHALVSRLVNAGLSIVAIETRPDLEEEPGEVRAGAKDEARPGGAS